MNEDMTGTSIDLKATLRSIAYLRRQLVERLADIEDSVNQALGKEALIIDDMFDYERLAEKLQGPLDGRFLAPELLQRIYRDNRRYCWHNRSITIHIEPVREGNSKGFLCIAEPGVSSFIGFDSMTEDLTEYGTHSIWEIAEARIAGFADGYIKATCKTEKDALEKVAGLGGSRVFDEDGRKVAEFAVDPDEPIRTKDGRIGPSVAKGYYGG